MHPDPIVEEIRNHFEELAARFDFDVDRLFDHFREEQARHPERRVVTEVPRRIPEDKLVPPEG
jgi:hypothetical protein